MNAGGSIRRVITFLHDNVDTGPQMFCVYFAAAV